MKQNGGRGRQSLIKFQNLLGSIAQYETVYKWSAHNELRESKTLEINFEKSMFFDDNLMMQLSGIMKPKCSEIAIV